MSDTEPRPDGLRLQAEELIAEERYDEAEVVLRAAVGAGDPGAMIDLGNLYLGFDRLDEAKALYRSASGSSDRAIAATGTINYAHVLGSEGQLGEAERLYREVIAADLGSRSVDAMRSLGMLLVMEERLDEAESLYRGVIAVADGEDRAFAWLRFPPGDRRGVSRRRVRRLSGARRITGVAKDLMACGCPSPDRANADGGAVDNPGHAAHIQDAMTDRVGISPR